MFLYSFINHTGFSDSNKPTIVKFSQFLRQVESGSMSGIYVQIVNESEFTWSVSKRKMKSSGKLTDDIMDLMIKKYLTE